METKPGILYLMRILEQYTDEEHPLTTKQLIELLLQKILLRYKSLEWIL